VNQANAKAPSTTVAVPVPEVQKILDAIASQSQQAAANTPGKPVTKEAVEAQLRAQLKQLGINY
jgi:hypothetical protein